MDAPAPAHLKEMYKLIKFVLSTKDYALKFKLIKSMKKWVLITLSDSDLASDKETRTSIFGYVIYSCGIPIPWRSKGMKSVVLSTTEAEYVALSEVVKELKFIVQLVENSSSRFYLISCSQWILNSSRLSCYLLLRLLVYMYLSQLMRTFTNYLKCIVISS